MGLAVVLDTHAEEVIEKDSAKETILGDPETNMPMDETNQTNDGTVDLNNPNGATDMTRPPAFTEPSRANPANVSY